MSWMGTGRESRAYAKVVVGRLSPGQQVAASRVWPAVAVASLPLISSESSQAPPRAITELLSLFSALTVICFRRAKRIFARTLPPGAFYCFLSAGDLPDPALPALAAWRRSRPPFQAPARPGTSHLLYLSRWADLVFPRAPRNLTKIPRCHTTRTVTR